MDKDEAGGPKGRSTMVSRAGHEYVKSVQYFEFVLKYITFFKIDFFKLLLKCILYTSKYHNNVVSKNV